MKPTQKHYPDELNLEYISSALTKLSTQYELENKEKQEMNFVPQMFLALHFCNIFGTGDHRVIETLGTIGLDRDVKEVLNFGLQQCD